MDRRLWHLFWVAALASGMTLLGVFAQRAWTAAFDGEWLRFAVAAGLAAAAEAVLVASVFLYADWNQRTRPSADE